MIIIMSDYPFAYFITCHAKYQSLSKLLLPSSYNIIAFTSYSTSLLLDAHNRLLEISIKLSEGLLSRYTGVAFVSAGCGNPCNRLAISN